MLQVCAQSSLPAASGNLLYFLCITVMPLFTVWAGAAVWVPRFDRVEPRPHQGTVYAPPPLSPLALPGPPSFPVVSSSSMQSREITRVQLTSLLPLLFHLPPRPARNFPQPPPLLPLARLGPPSFPAISSSSVQSPEFTRVHFDNHPSPLLSHPPPPLTFPSPPPSSFACIPYAKPKSHSDTILPLSPPPRLFLAPHFPCKVYSSPSYSSYSPLPAPHPLFSPRPLIPHAGLRVHWDPVHI